MAAERLSMRKVREVLKLRWADGLGVRAVAKSLGISPSTVLEYVSRAKEANLDWPLDPELDDAALEARLFPTAPSAPTRPAPDCQKIHRELARKHVTLGLLWREYKQSHPEDGYQYTQFCEHYRQYRAGCDAVMRQDHKAGEKMFVDFAGSGIPITDRTTGEVRESPLFVAALGASSYTFALAVEREDLPCWIKAHIAAWEFFGGVAEITVPDNTKAGVKSPCRYDPDLNPTYLELSQHYNTTVLPARPYKPRDKAIVETAVGIVQNWILAKLRNHVFFTIAEANEAVALLLDELNGKQFQKLDTTRRTLFEELDRPVLRPLPRERYELARWIQHRKVGPDYHVEVEHHYYSVPYQLLHKPIDVRWTSSTVECFYRGKRVASHPRSYTRGGHTTVFDHMPKAHQKHLEWTPARILAWAGETGSGTRELVHSVLKSRPHPEQGYRACLGIISLGKRYGQARLEAAARRALAVGAASYRSLRSILMHGLDRQPSPERSSANGTEILPLIHENLRGADYYKEALDAQ